MPNEGNQKAGSVKAVAAIVVLAFGVGSMTVPGTIANHENLADAEGPDAASPGATLGLSCIHILMQWPFIVIHLDECAPSS